MNLDELVGLDDSDALSIIAQITSGSAARPPSAPGVDYTVMEPRMSKLLEEERLAQLAKAPAAPTAATHPAVLEAREARDAVALLQKELAETRVANTLRERELRSIVDACRTTLLSEAARQAEIKALAHAKELAEAHTAIRQLQEVITRKDETVSHQRSQLDKQHEAVDEARRDTDREWRVVEGEMKIELSRLRVEKEKLRFEKEVAINRLENANLSTTAVVHRASLAESAWFDEQRRSLIRLEERWRSEIMNTAKSGLETMFHLMSMTQALDDYHAVKGEEMWRHSYAMVEQHVLPIHRVGVPLPPAPSQGAVITADATQFLADELLDEIVALRTLAEAETRLVERTEQERRDQLLSTLQTGVDHFQNQLAVLMKNTEKKVAQMTERCKTSERVVEQLSQRVHAQAGMRASNRASLSVVEQLVEEHSFEINKLRSEKRLLQQQLEEARSTSFVDEVTKLRKTNMQLEQSLAAALKDAATSKAKWSALHASASSMSEGAAQQLALLQAKTAEADSWRRKWNELHDEAAARSSQYDAKEAAHQQEVQRLRADLSQAEDHAANAACKVEKLLHDNNTLREKFVNDRSSEQVALVEKRLRRSSEEPNVSHLQAQAEVDSLRQRVVLLKKENDSLHARLDAALAEASHAEVQREQSIQRCLKLMAKEDAAPIRENGLLQLEAELSRRQRELERREQDLEKRSKALRGEERPPRMGPSSSILLPRGSQLPPVDPAAVVVGHFPEEAQLAALSRGSAAAAAPTKLAPLLIHRPQAAQEPSLVPHPQRYQ